MSEAREKLELAFFESADFLCSDWSQLGFACVENDAQITWTESAVLAPTDLYGCVPLVKVCRTENDVKQGEQSETNGKTFKSGSVERNT